VTPATSPAIAVEEVPIDELRPDPASRPWPELIAEGVRARHGRDGAQWALGDLALEVETTYGGQELQRFADDVGIEHNTLQEYRRVARAYEKSTRVDNLPWRHHQVVAARDDRLRYLARAAEGGWTTRRLREELGPRDFLLTESEGWGRRHLAQEVEAQRIREQPCRPRRDAAQRGRRPDPTAWSRDLAEEEGFRQALEFLAACQLTADELASLVHPDQATRVSELLLPARRKLADFAKAWNARWRLRPQGDNAGTEAAS
jgi:hypothetical protein